MFGWRRVSAAAARLKADQHGNVGMFMAVAAIPLIAASGGAIDFARLHTARTEVQSAADAAVLAGTRQLLKDPAKPAAALNLAQSYFDQNVSTATPLRDVSISFSVNATNSGLIATGNAGIQTSFLSVINISELALFADGATISAADSTPAVQGDLEVSLMLDVTGSMCNDGIGPCTGGDKVTGLKQAANTLIDTVVWDDQSEYTSKVAIVPFSTRVRVAPNGNAAPIMKTLTNLSSTWTGWYKTCTAGSGSGGSESGGNWSCSAYAVKHYANAKIMPCVTDRFYNASNKFDLTDDAPGSGRWLNAHDGSRMTLGWDSSNAAATSKLGKTKGDPADHWNYTLDGSCADIGNSNQIMPLSNDKSALKARINGLEAFGATAGVLGTAFSWYMISPNWKTVWTGTAAPKDYGLLTEKNTTGAPKLRKVAILMTDGVYNTYRGWKEQDKKVLSDNAIAMCAAMKAKGIEIYTVGFALDELSVSDRTIAEKTLASCGSDVDHFYQSINSEQLAAAFSEIGAKVSTASVRLTR